ncbi:MAG TPA: C45 family autoproteolytic acyltransferase/hydrolase [Candidatus Hydrogenedentes bacterium]|nr:C45 family autoproteolytic acyltransferase/hydrolase [Candidatus Hydrogenedentota bacterium]
MLISYLLPRSPRLLPEQEHQRVMSACRMDMGDAIPALYLSGTHYEMGYQHGQLAKDLIHAFRDKAVNFVASHVEKEYGAPAWLAPMIAPSLLVWESAGYRRTIPSGIYDEVKGIADGAGIHPLEVVAATAIWEIYMAHGCSEFVAANEMTPDGSMIHGFNDDQPSSQHAFASAYLAMIFYAPVDGLPFCTQNTVGTVGLYGGMNTAGISVAWDNTHTKDRTLYGNTKLPAVPYVVTLRRLLEESSTLDQAIQVVCSAMPRPLADIIIIGSAHEKKAVALETAGSTCATRPLEEGVVWSTNHFRSETLAPHDRQGDWRTMDATTCASKFPRHVAYEQLFKKYAGEITPEVAAKIVRDPYPREADGYLHPPGGRRTTICRATTNFTFIMQAGKGLIWASDGKFPAPQGDFLAFDLKARARRPELDIKAAGYRDALGSARAFLENDLPSAEKALNAAIEKDGETAPLLMMRAVLAMRNSDAASAEKVIASISDRWPETVFARMAGAWSEKKHAEMPAIPFPSAIAPLLYFEGNPQAPCVANK